MYKNEKFYALICIKNHVITSLNCILLEIYRLSYRPKVHLLISATNFSIKPYNLLKNPLNLTIGNLYLTIGLRVIWGRHFILTPFLFERALTCALMKCASLSLILVRGHSNLENMRFFRTFITTL